MNWTRAGQWHFASDTGYRIAVTRDGMGLLYSAFAPALDYEAFKDLCRVRYARGEVVPQQSALLGCFIEPEPARQACARHAGESFILNSGEQHETENCNRIEYQARDAGEGRQIGLGL